MKILLLGEYSGVHNNLKKALTEEGHDVLLISDGDGYKSFDSDYYIQYKKFSSRIKSLNFLLKIYYVLLNLSGFKGSIQILKHIKYISQLKNYDVVQLINPIFLNGYGSVVNYFVFKYLNRKNVNIYLCALGDDYYWVKYCLAGKYNYSMFDRLNIKNFRYYLYSLYYVYGFLNPYLNKFIVNNVRAIIPGLYDYYLPYKNLIKCTSITPIIIDEVCEEEINVNHHYPIRIFHGWQKGKELRKGNDIFDKAIQRLIKKYGPKIEYNVVSGLPYSVYIQKFNDAHIFIDQCYSQDRGVNALLGMRAGKVVFTGFEECVKDYYSIGYDPVINSTPNEEQIYHSLVRLVEMPELIDNYSSNAKKFLIEFHNPRYVVSKYLDIWTKNNR